MYAARSAGLSWEKSFYLGVVNGIAFYAGPLGPAFAGATSAAILHGNIWEGTWKAQVSSIGSNMFGSLIGGGISAELNGGDFEHGMSEAAYNLAAVAAISSANNYRNAKQLESSPRIAAKLGSGKILSTDKEIDVWIEADKNKIAYKAGDFQRGKVIISLEQSGQNINIDYGGDNKIDAVLRVDAGNRPSSAIIHIEDMGKTIHWQDLNHDGEMFDYVFGSQGIEPVPQEGEVVIK